MTLLERQNQLEDMRAALADAVGGRGSVVLLTGEAGSGKTSLLRAFLDSAGEVRILRSFCEDLSVPEALGPLYDLSREARSPLTRGPGRSQVSLFSDALTMLAAGPRPTISVIEDLHWADDATLDFVRYVGRRIEPMPLLLVLTARTEAAAGQRRLRKALADVAPPLVRRVTIPLLSEGAVEALARDNGVDGRAIYRATGGNAFFVTELLKAGSTSGATQSVREAVLARVDVLEPGARAAVDLVSVFPRRAEAELLVAILGDTAALETAVEAGILERSDDTYAFRHEIARQAVEAELSEPARRALNGRVLAALRNAGELAVARLAHHAWEARDSVSIAELAPLAGEWASSVGAHHQAARHFENATSMMPRRPDLLQQLAIECHMVGRLDEAIAAGRRALEIHQRTGNIREQGASLRWLSRFSYLAGRRNDAVAFGEQAVAVLTTVPEGPELATAYANLSQLEMLADHEAAALDWGNRALVLAEHLGRSDIVCAALNNMGTAQRWHSLEAAREALDRSLGLALANDWHEHAARAYTNLGCGLVERRELDDGIATLTAGIAYCAERDLDTLKLYMTGWLARANLLQGQWQRAQEQAGLVLADELATALARYQASETLARLRLRRGDPDPAEPIADLERLLDSGREFQRLAPYATLRAEQAWITGAGAAQALKLLEQARSLSPAPSANDDIDFWTAVLQGADADWPALAERSAAIGLPFEGAVALLHCAGDAAAMKALALFERLGATACVEQARRILAERGFRGPRRSTLANSVGLTTRELGVLNLLAEGLSNKAIAASLGISPKTVDHHVSAVIGKLDAQTRGQAVAVARERGVI